MKHNSRNFIPVIFNTQRGMDVSSREKEYPDRDGISICKTEGEIERLIAA